MVQCYVSVGSNIDKATNINAGLCSLRDAFGELNVSPIYETAAIGFDGDDFYNLVVGFESNLPAFDVAQQLRELEFFHGRFPNSQKFSPRSLDLDLLLYGDAIINDENLKLPRVDIENYIFVLQPLADLAPNLNHPIQQKTYRKMLELLLEKSPEQTIRLLNLT